MADPADATAARSRRPSRGRRILRVVVLSVLGLLAIAVVGVVIWSQVGVMPAEAEPLAAVEADSRLSLEERDGSLVLEPADGGSDVGMVFIPGAKVEASAYAAKLADLVSAADVTVVIARPWLNLAFFDLRPLSAFTDAAPAVDTWLVGGHSLGGVRACQLAEDADGLVLFASYCAADLSASGLPVLSLSGSADGLTTADKIADARPLLPADATLVEIPGAAHSSFGDYGSQAGDGTPTISDPDMTAALTASVAELVAALPR
ncbi:alpha/beta hydrolase [Microbacterium sp. 179-B 1A2 NHS]|uniref:alpha/beta hydrolase n=1 Tax=Microbacterium sp. 179-B 1A2 NHS TaxID=3142383 RepID=UPI0039A1B3F7